MPFSRCDDFLDFVEIAVDGYSSASVSVLSWLDNPHRLTLPSTTIIETGAETLHKLAVSLLVEAGDVKSSG